MEVRVFGVDYFVAREIANAPGELCPRQLYLQIFYLACTCIVLDVAFKSARNLEGSTNAASTPRKNQSLFARCRKPEPVNLHASHGIIPVYIPYKLLQPLRPAADLIIAVCTSH